ncbi:AraC family transcriptional regulator [Flavisphingomonas formosensis]|uniref:AraC family transcriptional regulator n=1 Tax=Flavisphingomonas formosensis TaxID=861534 RepID=UPI0018E053DD|nr:AraC family transcriptional regulator ligand-binding domain-containing protein [Sphingomonas formosensis]
MTGNRMTHHFAQTLLDCAARRGLDPCLLTDGRMLAGDEQWHGQDFYNFLYRVGDALQDEYFGLASDRCPPGTAQLGIEMLVLSEDLGDALQRSCRFYRIASKGLRLRLVQSGEMAIFEIMLAEPACDEGHFLTEWTMLRWYMLCQWLIGEEISLERVDFPHAMQTALADYTEVFGHNIHFSQQTARFFFSIHYLSRKVIRRLKNIEGDWVRRRAAEFTEPDIYRAWKELLKAALRARMARMNPIPTMEKLAEEFGVCGQTLRRRLKAERTSYRKLKAEARREMVLEGIRNEELTLGQISLMAGFAETNGLVRAMKSWTGLTPSQYRKHAMPQRDDDALH